MSDLPGFDGGSLSRQQPMQDSGAWSASIFTRFQEEDIEQSIADRFQGNFYGIYGQALLYIQIRQIV